jgi:cullin 1
MGPTSTILIAVCYHLIRLEHVFHPTLVDFESKKLRVNLNWPTKAEINAESSDVFKTVDGDRKYVIQATIVRYVLIPGFYGIMGHPSETCVTRRTMKARKTMETESLIQEVVSQLSKRFAPEVPAIKKVCRFLLYSLLRLRVQYY